MERSTCELTTLAVLVAGMTLAAAAAHAAKRLEPPTLMMMDRYQQVAAVVAEDSPEDGKVTFRRLEAIYGEMPERVVARLDTETLGELVWEQSYVFAYTEMRRNPKDRDSPEIDPEGPKVVALPVIGAALLEDTPEVRFLFAAAKGREADPGRTYLDALLTQLERPDARTRRFVIAEMYLRPELFRHLEERDLPPIRSAMTSPEVDTESRSFLLESAQKFPASLRGVWLDEIGRRIVADAPTELDLDSTRPLLVKTALQVLAAGGEASDAELLARHFRSNSPGVAKAALAALMLIDPDAAATRAREVLASDATHQSTRRAMEQFLERHERGESG